MFQEFVDQNGMQYKTLQTGKVIRYDELDKGFILRANEEVTYILRYYIKYGQIPPEKFPLRKKVPDQEGGDQDIKMDEGGKNKKEKLDLEMINLDVKKRRYGIRLGNVIYLATLVDLPCIVEAMKTLDYFNFFKSQDASQMMYVHPKKIDLSLIGDDQNALKEIINNYDPVVEDKVFLDNLYEREKYNPKQQGKNPYYCQFCQEPDCDSQHDDLKFRHGISPVTKNIRNLRFKRKPKFDKNQVAKVEKILKDHIDYGFADNVDESLLEFNDEGKLHNIHDGKSHDNLHGLPSVKGFPGSMIEEDDDEELVDSDSYQDNLSSVTGGMSKSVHQFQDSASASNFRQDFSDQKPYRPVQQQSESSNIIGSMIVPMDNNYIPGDMPPPASRQPNNANKISLFEDNEKSEYDELNSEITKKKKLVEKYRTKIAQCHSNDQDSQATALKREAEDHIQEIKEMKNRIKELNSQFQ